jgi:hypothetical protein
MGKLLAGIIVGGLAVYAYQRARQPEPVQVPLYDQAPGQDQASEPPAAVEIDNSNFHCDGRTYCSQMTSCAEATYFLQHCPGVKMDGEGDGVPCERQWCGRH